MPTEVSVKVGGVTLALRVWRAEISSGRPPVVLLPATGETAEDWDVVASTLQRSRTVFAVNMRGHGESDWPGTYSTQLMADDVIGLLDSGIDDHPVDLVGHSLGGLIACSVTAARPDLVRRLVLEEIGLLQPRPPDPPVQPEGVLAFDWGVVAQVRPEIDNFDPRWADVVASITVPTLVVAGGACSPIPQHHISNLTRQLPRGRMVTVDAGHLVHATKPDDFTNHMLDFLDG